MTTGAADTVATLTTAAHPPLLQVSHLGVQLKGKEVLADVSFDVHAGSVVALLGRNGAGKSTLMQTIANLRHPSRGSVQVAGAPAGSADARMAMSVVLQSVDFPVTVRVGELLTHVARHYPQPQDPHAVAERLGLEGCWSRQAGGLSGGEERRLALACALVARPRLVMLDEPTAGLDREGSEQLWSVLADLAAGGGAVLFSTHLLAEVERHADRVLLLDAGQVVADESPGRLASSLGLTRVALTAPQDQRKAPALTGAPDCTRVAQDGDRWSFLTPRPDDLVRWLVHTGIPFGDLSIDRLDLGDAVDELLRQQASSHRVAS